jgi:RNA polymerase sigma factor (TIGR02999 family)
MDDLSLILQDLSDGKQERRAELFERVEAELRRLAAGTIRRSGQDPLLQTTALINEAYLKLVGNTPVRWDGKAHFFQSAARAMRQVLVDYARQRRAVKRGGQWIRVSLGPEILAEECDLVRLLVIDQALVELQQVNARCAEVVNLRFFAGLSVEEVAEMLRSSPRTVKRDWEFARVWLERQLELRAEPGGAGTGGGGSDGGGSDRGVSDG